MPEEVQHDYQVIAIDGPAGSGKTTIAKLLAEKLGYHQLDSGALYRAATLLALEFAERNKLTFREVVEKPEFRKEIEVSPLRIEFFAKKQRLYLKERRIDEDLRSFRINQKIKPIADSPFVRNWVSEKLNTVADKYNVVIDGRDIGTEVFPQANKKFYLTATLGARVKRRLRETDAVETEQEIEQLTKSIDARDYQDKIRKVGSLKKAKDAIEIDTTEISQEEVLDVIKEHLTPIKKEEQTLPEKNPSERNLPDVQKSQTLQKQQTKESKEKTIKESSTHLDIRTDNTAMEKLMNEGGFNVSDIQKGDIVMSKVIRREPAKNPEYILVDLNSKSEGIIPIEEFDTIPDNGMEIEAIVISFDRETGFVKLSKKSLDIHRAMDLLENSYANELPVTGKIIKKLSKGYIVDIEKVEMFLPHSHIGSVLQDNLKNNRRGLIGNTYTYNIIDLDKKRATGVVSRKKWQDAQNQSHWEDFVNTTEVGTIVNGQVLHHVRIGVFVQVQNLIGFLHQSNISWRKQRKKLEELYLVGSEIKVRILDIDQENMKMSLGLKQLTENPWETIMNDLQVGSRIRGTVSYLARHGAFVDLDNDLDGFVPIDEISWARKLDHPSKALNIGDKLDFKVLGVNSKEKKITLGIKQLQENPWKKVADNIKIGDIRRGKIKYITSYGMFIQIEDNIDGLIRREDISWHGKSVEPKQKYKKNQEIDFKIINIDEENRKIACGIKHLKKNPYEELKKKYSNKPLIVGKVLKIVDYGIFILLLDDDMTGLAHRRDIPPSHIKKIKRGDEVKVIVKQVDLKNERISLSLKESESAVEKVEMGRYINKKDEILTSNPFSKLKDMIAETQ